MRWPLKAVLEDFVPLNQQQRQAKKELIEHVKYLQKQLELQTKANLSDVLPLAGPPTWLCTDCLSQWNAWAAAIEENKKRRK